MMYKYEKKMFYRGSYMVKTYNLPVRKSSRVHQPVKHFENQPSDELCGFYSPHHHDLFKCIYAPRCNVYLSLFIRKSKLTILWTTQDVHDAMNEPSTQTMSIFI